MQNPKGPFRRDAVGLAERAHPDADRMPGWQSRRKNSGVDRAGSRDIDRGTDPTCLRAGLARNSCRRPSKRADKSRRTGERPLVSHQRGACVRGLPPFPSPATAIRFRGAAANLLARMEQLPDVGLVRPVPTRRHGERNLLRRVHALSIAFVLPTPGGRCGTLRRRKSAS